MESETVDKGRLLYVEIFIRGNKIHQSQKRKLEREYNRILQKGANNIEVIDSGTKQYLLCAGKLYLL